MTADQVHADQAVEKLLLNFWKQSESSFEAQCPGSGTATGYWTFAQAADAVLDGVQRTGGERFFGFMQTFYLAQQARGWSRDYYDDENWMALALIRAYDLSGATDTGSLDEAEALVADIMANAWDTTCCGPNPGGDWWDTAHTQKATASNAGPVISAVRLYQRTGDAKYLAFAEKVYDYWVQQMVDPRTFQVADHLIPDGGKVWWKFTYNEGLMVGAAASLHSVTGLASELQDAEDIASFAESSEVSSSDAGLVLTDGPDSSCSGDCSQFKGIAHRYLTLLDSVVPSPKLSTLLTDDATAIWSLDRSPSQTLFGADWAGPPVTSTLVSSQSSATMALNLAAEAEGPWPGATWNADTYEAEDGVLHGLGYEASNGGFSGWGYLAGWNADGQWVDFHPAVPQARSYRATFRYANATGSASRYVYVNGATAVDNLAFPSTGSWSTYATATVDVTLGAGSNTISLIYNSSKGSTSYVNLDSLTLEPTPTCSQAAPPAPLPTSPIAGSAWCSAPTLCWSTSSGTSRYQVILDDSVACTTTTATCCTPSTWSAAPHRWYVVASNACASQAGPARQLIGGAPVGSPSGPSPADGAAVTSTPTLTWTAAPGALTYDVWLDQQLICAGLVVESCTPATVASGADSWTVTAHGVCGDSSASWSFTR